MMENEAREVLLQEFNDERWVIELSNEEEFGRQIKTHTNWLINCQGILIKEISIDSFF